MKNESDSPGEIDRISLLGDVFGLDRVAVNWSKSIEFGERSIRLAPSSSESHGILGQSV